MLSEFRCFGTDDLAAMFSPSWQAPSFLSQKSLFKIIGDLKARPWRVKPLDLALSRLKWHGIYSIVLP
jgi:hypothetical protein